MAFWKKNPLESGLREILGKEGILCEKADVACYGFDSSGLEAEPYLVALPESIEQVCKIARLCNRLEIPLVPRGAGSSTTGSAVPVRGGVVLSFSRMNRILRIDPVELTARLEPGVVTGVLQEEVEKRGLFYPPDPASLRFCTIGGNVATGAGGARAVKYGVTKDYVRSLKVVLSDGNLIHTGSDTAKGVAGYDLTHLFVGSEGTLGIVVEILLRLLPLPEAVGTAVALFDDLEWAVEAVTCLFTSGILPRCAEFLDEKSLSVASKALPFEVPEEARAFLLLEVDGTISSVKSQLSALKACLKRSGAIKVLEARDAKERERLWEARRSVSPALKGLGYDRKISEDICVPRRAIKAMLSYLKEIQPLYPVDIFTFGHLGDGNLHVNLLFNSNELDDQGLDGLIERIMKRCLELGGTISGEHGIGLTKMKYLGLELSSQVVGLERQIKKVFDPKGILNPGKIFEE